MLNELKAELERPCDRSNALAPVHEISMLHFDAIAGWSFVAGRAVGRIVEIGPYIGGSTVAMAMGLGDSCHPIISIEAGGSYDHYALPSSDIVRDLRSNLERFNVADRVHLLVGKSRDAHIKSQLISSLSDEKIGLVFIDSDGRPLPDLAFLSRFMVDDCFIVVDDYDAPLAGAKAEMVRKTIDLLTADGVLTCYVKTEGGTWFGHLNGHEARVRLATFDQPFDHDSGFAYCVPLSTTLRPDNLSDGSCSKLQLFEDGRPLGPGNSLHRTIRDVGRGAYSHWGEGSIPIQAPPLYGSALYFSASDNSNPNTNGRAYSVRIPGGFLSLKG